MCDKNTLNLITEKVCAAAKEVLGGKLEKVVLSYSPALNLNISANTNNPDRLMATAFIRAAALLALLAWTAAAGIKYVAVVETGIDERSGAGADITSAEVALMTAELRRAAVDNLPRDRFSVMTSETVQSMGGAVLEECAEENCVITLGARIGADYIVRGVVSKLRARFTLSVELYETDNGTLLASSEPIRSESVDELVEKAAEVSGAMFRKFAGTQVETKTKKSKTKPEVPAKTYEPAMTAGADQYEQETSGEGRYHFYFTPRYQLPLGMPVSWGGVNAEVGWVWRNGVLFGIDVDFGYSNSYDDYYYEDKLLIGVGLSVGKEFDLGNQMQVAVGGSVGIWTVEDRYDEFSISNGWREDNSYNFLAPFVKFRWYSIEIMYRGLLGVYDNYEYSGGYDSYDPNVGFGWNSHQLMIGYTIGGRKNR